MNQRKCHYCEGSIDPDEPMGAAWSPNGVNRYHVECLEQISDVKCYYIDAWSAYEVYEGLETIR
jgi:hypothetical protein